MDNVTALEEKISDLSSQMGLAFMKAETAESKTKLIEKTSRRMEEITAVLSAKIDELSAVAGHSEVCSERIEKLEVKVQRLAGTDSGASLKGDIASILEKCESFEADRERIDSLYETLSTITEEIGDNKDSVDTIAENLASLDKKCDARINQMLDSAKLSFGELSARIDSIEEKPPVTGAHDGGADFDAAIRDIKVSIADIKTSYLGLKNDFSSRLALLEEKSSARDAVMMTVQKSADAVREELNRLSEKTADAPAAAAPSQEDKMAVEEAVRRIESLERKIADVAIRLDSLAAKAPSADSELSSKLAELEARIVSIPTSSEVRASAVKFDPADLFENPKPAKDIGFELDDLLQVMIKHQASDLHLKDGAPPTVRLEGELIPIGSEILDADTCKYLIMSGVPAHMRRQVLSKKELDFSYSIPEARFRVHVFMQRGTVSASYRMIKTSVPSVEALNLPQHIRTFANLPSGLVILSGAAGCGKTTALASLIDYVNTNSKLHIITIEDPIEYLHTDKLSLVAQREIGEDAISYASAIRSALREDPNIIVSGDIDSYETLSAAISAAETGHLVLVSMYSVGAVETLKKLISLAPADCQARIRAALSSELRAIVSLQLLNREDGGGKIPASEILSVTPKISSLISEGRIADIYPLMVEGSGEGMSTFSSSLTALYESGVISKDDAIKHGLNKSDMKIANEESKEPPAAVQDDVMMSWL